MYHIYEIIDIIGFTYLLFDGGGHNRFFFASEINIQKLNSYSLALIQSETMSLSVLMSWLTLSASKLAAERISGVDWELVFWL